ncbi:MAG: DedA family protein [Bacilli bacterium]|nr:DedA family protein [Bacilli bacterium]
MILFIELTSLFEKIFNLIDEYGVYIIFLAIFLEYACFPLPSEVILPLAGAIGYNANISPVLMIALSSIAGLLGALLCYYLGVLGSLPFFKPESKEENDSISFYEKYGNWAILFGRLIPLCRTYISFVAGVKKHKVWKYILFSSIGIIIWNSILITLGYVFYDNIDIISIWYSEYKFIILGLICIIFIIVIIKKIKKRKKPISKDYVI